MPATNHIHQITVPVTLARWQLAERAGAQRIGRKALDRLHENVGTALQAVELGALVAETRTRLPTGRR
jgi:hypothetical protein